MDNQQRGWEWARHVLEIHYLDGSTEFKPKVGCQHLADELTVLGKKGRVRLVRRRYNIDRPKNLITHVFHEVHPI